MPRQIQTHSIKGHAVDCTIEGTGSNPCLFIGPWQLYSPSFPDAAKTELFTFYDADRYFAYPIKGEKVPESEIAALSLPQYVEYYEEARKALKLEKMTIMAPSAIGLVAHAYAKKYPQNVAGIILLGTPSTTTNLVERQKIFMEGNYNPKTYPKLATEESRKKWARHETAQTKFSEQLEKKPDPDTALTQELVANQAMYNVIPASESDIQKRWGRFNTTMRHYFFGSKEVKGMIQDYEIKGEVPAPTLHIAGMFDGVAPCYDLIDKFKKGAISGKFDHFIVSDAAHSPQESQEFVPAIKNWLKTLPEEKERPLNSPGLT